MVETSYLLVTPVRFGEPSSISAVRSPGGRPQLPIALTDGVQMPRFTPCLPEEHS